MDQQTLESIEKLLKNDKELLDRIEQLVNLIASTNHRIDVLHQRMQNMELGIPPSWASPQ